MTTNRIRKVWVGTLSPLPGMAEREPVYRRVRLHTVSLLTRKSEIRWVPVLGCGEIAWRAQIATTPARLLVVFRRFLECSPLLAVMMEHSESHVLSVHNVE